MKSKSKKPAILIGKLADLHVDSTIQRGCRPFTVINRRSFARRLQRLWPNRRVTQFTRPQLLQLRKKFSADFLKRLLQLLRYAWRKEHLSADLTHGLFESQLRDHPTPSILSPTEAQRLYNAVLPEWRAAFVLALYAGLRPTEICRTKWSHINIVERRIRVPASVSKVRHLRVIEGTGAQPIPTILWSQLARAHEEQGQPRGYIVPNCRRNPRGRVGFGDFARLNFWARERVAIARRARVKLPTDVFRHSAITYFIAHTGSPGRAAIVFGTSEQYIRDHYDGHATKQEAHDYYHPKPILALPEQSAPR